MFFFPNLACSCKDHADCYQSSWFILDTTDCILGLAGNIRDFAYAISVCDVAENLALLIWLILEQWQR